VFLPVTIDYGTYRKLRFNIGSSGQQVHIGIGKNEPGHSRHPCFRVESGQALLALRAKIYDHYVKGGASAPIAADKPGEVASGSYLLCYLIKLQTK
jgi:hypothetical protein